MEFSEALTLGRNALWMMLMVSAPVLVIGLAVGLTIALFQAVTQLQEQTLTFVPKIAAMVLAAVLFIPWIMEQMVEYSRKLFSGMPWQ
jgi:flagellar biosynthetic protein FliQ